MSGKKNTSKISLDLIWWQLYLLIFLFKIFKIPEIFTIQHNILTLIFRLKIWWHVPFLLERIWWEDRVFKTWNWFSTTFPSMILPRMLQASGATNFWRSLWETYQLRSRTLQCIPGYKQVQFHNNTDFWNTVLTNSAPTDIIINVIYFKFFLFRTWLTIETINFLPFLKKLK